MTKVIAELGINHNGDLGMARRLIDIAHRSKAWGIKFQYRNLARTYGSDIVEIGDEIVHANISRSHLSPDDLIALASYASHLGLQVGTSFFSEEDISDLSSFNFDFYKVPSAELTNLPLLRRLLASESLVLASTGMSTEAEILEIRDCFGSYDNLVVFHCVSNYPTDSLNSRLGYISRLRSLFGPRVGYSSHDKEWEVCLLALGFGVEFIERHLTLDRAAVGTDQSSSLEPDDFLKLVDFARKYPEILAGNEPRRVNQGERMNRQNLGRSLYVKKTVERGEVVVPTNLSYVAPQVGISWIDWEQLAGLPVSEKISAGSPLLKRRFGPRGADALDRSVSEWAVANKISSPVRIHDFEIIHAAFGLAAYEFHLSYREVDDLRLPGKVSAGANYSVHLPDYVGNDFLIDPFSTNSHIRNLSLTVFQKVADFAESLAVSSGNDVPVVCSLSNTELSRDLFYSGVKSLFADFERPGVQFSLQWLPPVAWYFGGSVRLDRVNSSDDIGHILAEKTPITMDISHLVMGENSGAFYSSEVFDSLEPSVSHFHISGAEGVDGEGTAFDFSKLAERVLLDRIFLSPEFRALSKVIEVWQGHLDNFAGFREALVTLHARYSRG